MSTIVIADALDHAQGLLESLLADDADFNVVGTAGHETELLDLLKVRRPSILLVRVAGIKEHSRNLIRRVVVEYPNMKVVVVSECSRMSSAVAAFESGADGFIAGAHVDQELRPALRVVLSGLAYMSQSVRHAE